MEKRPLDAVGDCLASHGARLTDNRALVYNTLAQAEAALSLSDIELLLEEVDKSTIFRSLQLFLEVGLLHRIDDGSGIFKYALTSTREADIARTHAHFYCTQCERTYCIEGVACPNKINLPEGYTLESANLVIKGCCANCRKR